MINKSKYILPTIGPSSEDEKSLKQILKLCNVVRLNGSHNTLRWHEAIIKKIKKIDDSTVILFDIPGIKPRTMNKTDISIKKNQIIKLTDKNYNKISKNVISLSNPIPLLDKKTDGFSISDGQYHFKITKKGKGFIEGKSLSNCIIKPKKGVNIPFSSYDEKLQCKVYEAFIRKSKKIGYDALGISFIQDAKTLSYLKAKFPEIIIVSKIENAIGLKNLSDICLNSDAVMIDRGDLSAEIKDYNLFSAITSIAKETKLKGKPLIMATENLDSMQSRSSPTKSEIVSLGYSTSLNTDKIMLSEETAISPNWKNIMTWLNKFLLNENNTLQDLTFGDRQLKEDKNYSIWRTVSQLEGIPIIIFSRSGEAIQKVKSVNPYIKILVFTDTDRTIKLSKFWKNVECIKLKHFDNTKGNKFVFNTLKSYRAQVFNKNKSAAILYISDPKPGSRANTISIIQKDEFF